MRLQKFLQEQYEVKLRKPQKYKKINPKTNRMKTFRKTRWEKTDIPPEKRTLDNIPKYADGRPKVRFQDWLEIDTSKSKAKNWGWGCDGKCYGWSHRAIYGFQKGEKINLDTVGNHSGKEFILQSDKDVENMAISFAKRVS